MRCKVSVPKNVRSVRPGGGGAGEAQWLTALNAVPALLCMAALRLGCRLLGLEPAPFRNPQGKEKDKGELKDRLPNTGPNHNRYLGFGHFNDILFRVPFYNLLHPFLCLNADQMLWSQFSVFLNNIGVVLALILALVCTFYSAVGYSEIQSADTRFDFGMEGTYLRTPWDQNYNTAAPTAAGSVFCSHPEAGNCTLGKCRVSPPSPSLSPPSPSPRHTLSLALSFSLSLSVSVFCVAVCLCQCRWRLATSLGLWTCAGRLLRR